MEDYKNILAQVDKYNQQLISRDVNRKRLGIGLQVGCGFITVESPIAQNLGPFVIGFQ